MALTKVAVLGAAGWIGRGLMEWFSARPGFQALGICRRPEQAAELRGEGLDAAVHSLGDPVLGSVLSACDAIIDAIRPAGPIPQWRDTENRIAALIAALPARVAAVYFSSVSQYAQFYRDAVREAEKPSARDVYARNKWYMETVLRKEFARRRRRLLLVRVGHVWGQRQLWSRVIGERHLDPRAGLLLDGAHASNSVHIFTLGSAIENALPGAPEVVVGNAIEQPQWTWRKLFDYHAGAYGLPPIPSAPDDFSRAYVERRRRLFARSLGTRLVGECGSWLTSLPGSFVKSCPAANELAARTLVAIGAEAFEEKLRLRFSGPASSGSASSPRVDYWMVGDPAPGSVLPSSFVLTPAHQAELGAWWKRCASENRSAAALELR